MPPFVPTQLDQAGVQCVLTDQGRQSAFAMLAAELLFLRGEVCKSLVDLPHLYEEHFGVALQLSCFGVDSVASLLQLPDVSSVIEVCLVLYNIIIIIGIDLFTALQIMRSNVDIKTIFLETRNPLSKPHIPR